MFLTKQEFTCDVFRINTLPLFLFNKSIFQAENGNYAEIFFLKDAFSSQALHIEICLNFSSASV